MNNFILDPVSELIIFFGDCGAGKSSLMVHFADKYLKTQDVQRWELSEKIIRDLNTRRKTPLSFPSKTPVSTNLSLKLKDRNRAGTNAAAWIARIAKNEALALKKKRGREFYVDEHENLNVFGTEQTDDFGLLTETAKKFLPEDEFLILMLAAAEGYKRREIAELLDMPVPTVTWKYKRATEKMRDIFRDGFGEE